MKKNREKIGQKFDGFCAYCGLTLPSKWHVDHVAPLFTGGPDTEENMVPACPRCNLRKSALSVEQFRHEIEKQTERLRRYNPAYRLASDFGLVSESGGSVVFHFERRGDEEKG